MNIPNIVADRYSSTEMKAIFDPINRVRVERRFWLTVLQAQIDAGLEAPEGVLADYESVLEQIDLGSIRQREAELKHDIPARLHEFNELAGHQHLHKGMTSRDLTENVELILMKEALELVQVRTAALAEVMAEKAAEYADVALVARTHNVPAQPTTLGKRFAQFAEELLVAYGEISRLLETFRLRGIKGPVGSAQDQINLLGSKAAALQVEQAVAQAWGTEAMLDSVGQVYPRSYDFQLAAKLYQLGSAPSNMATTLRLMAGLELASEGFGKNQVGSSAMPHKMNARSCERINGLYQVLRGYQAMVESLAGTQWNEGDVSCSVVRRVAIPNLFLTIDGLFETTFAVLRGFEYFPAVVTAELNRYLPFLSTTTLLMHAVKAGVGREEAHEIIKEHAVATALAIRNNGASGELLLDKLADDARFPGGIEQLQALVSSANDLLGNIDSQISTVVERVNKSIAHHGTDLSYRGAEIL